MFIFLVDTIMRIHTMDHEAFAGIPRGNNSQNDIFPYMPPQHIVAPPHGAPITIIGRSIFDQAHHENHTYPFVAQVCHHNHNKIILWIEMMEKIIVT